MTGATVPGQGPGRGREPACGAEALLPDYLVHLETRRHGRRAVHLRLSTLMPRHRRPHHVRTAVAGFHQHLAAADAQVFVLTNCDIFVVYVQLCETAVRREIARIRYLFSDDPLFADDSERGFAFDYDLGTDFGAFVTAVRRALQDGCRNLPAADEATYARSRIRERQQRGQTLTPDVLARIEAALAQTDLSSLARRQTVCAISGRNRPEPRFRELYISIADLRDTVLPGADFTADPWLFRHLTKTLDRRVLTLLAAPEEAESQCDISININISTLVSDSFAAFENNLSASRRTAFIFEVHPADVFSDIEAFLSARDSVHEKGCRICLDGLTHADMDLYDLTELGVDLVKLIWDERMLEMKGAFRARFRAFVEQAGPARLVLCRVDSRRAVEFGQAAGVSLFQGRYVEQLVSLECRRRTLSFGSSCGGRRSAHSRSFSHPISGS